jgi:hypothetical protein
LEEDSQYSSSSETLKLSRNKNDREVSDPVCPKISTPFFELKKTEESHALPERSSRDRVL